MKPVYTASVVGGGTGGKLNLDAFARSDRYQLVAAADISDTTRADLASRYPGVALYATHEEMLADNPTDVVCVATWPPTHLPITLAALVSHPKGIVCEKPLGDTYAAGAQLLSALKAQRLPVAVPHGLLKARQGEEITQRVLNGEIGQVELVQIECHGWDIINAGIHWLNFVVTLLPNDPIAWVMCAIDDSTRTYRDGMEVETTAITYAQTVAGVRIVMETGDSVQIMRANKGMLFRIIGTKGSIEFWAWQSAYHVTNADHPRGALFEPQPYPITSHQRHHEGLADQIDAGAPDYAIAESSLAALEVCEAAYLAAQYRCRIPFPLATFVPREPTDWHPGRPYRGHGGRDGRKL